MKFKTTVASDVFGTPGTDSRGRMVKRPIVELGFDLAKEDIELKERK